MAECNKTVQELKERHLKNNIYSRVDCGQSVVLGLPVLPRWP